MLTFIARIKLDEVAVPAFLATLPGLVAGTRAEPGCIQYDFNQSNDEPSLFLVYEKWADQAALDAHMETPHIQAFIADFGGSFAEPVTMTHLTPVG